MFAKKWYTSKTLWFNLALGVFALAEKFVADMGVTSGWLVSALVVGNTALRTVTNSAITVK